MPTQVTGGLKVNFSCRFTSDAAVALIAVASAFLLGCSSSTTDVQDESGELAKCRAAAVESSEEVVGELALTRAETQAGDIELASRNENPLACISVEQHIAMSEAFSMLPQPCGPDVNNDGALDQRDFSVVVALFIVAELRADFNDDGVIGQEDLELFAGLYLAGCP